MPAYNHQEYVEAAIRSVWSQTWRSLELVVIDDGSTDDTSEIVHRLQQKSPIPMIAQRKTNGGIASALNTAIDSACGTFVAVLASDDMMVPDRIERQIAEFLRDESVGILHTGAKRIDASGKILFSMQGRYLPATGCCLRGFMLGSVGVVAPTVMYRREVLEEVGAFDESLPFEDWPYFLRASASGVRFGYLSEDLTLWRVSPSNAGSGTSKWWRRSMEERRKYLDRLAESDRERAIQRMYQYEMSSAILQGGYGVFLDISRDAAARGCLRWNFAPVIGWAAARRIAQRLLTQRAYARLKGIRYAASQK